jgi:tight adherence protein C
MSYSIGITLLIIGFIILAWGLRSIATDRLSERLYIYLGGWEQADQGGTTIIPGQRKPQVTGSFRKRILLPALQSIARVFGRLTPGRLSQDLEKQLAVAGHPLGLGPREFYFIRFAFMVAGVALAFMIFQSNFYAASGPSGEMAIAATGSGYASPEPAGTRANLMGIIMSMLTLIIVSNLPRTWLRRRARIRRNSIVKSLPDALDMLSVCSEAGLGFDQAMQRVSNSWDNTLAREFGRVVTEMGMGLSRKIALRNLVNRTSVPELSSFVSVILQSDQLGMSITQTLHAQAKQMRIERRFRAQEQARKMPLKMLFPLILLIFPAMFAVILGPMIPVLGELFTALRP